MRFLKLRCALSVLLCIDAMTYQIGLFLSHRMVADGHGGDCAHMPRKSPFSIVLSKQERRALEGQVRRYTSSYCGVIRAKIVLLAAEGLGNDVIAARLDTPRQIVSKWRKRFALERLPGLEAQPRGGRPVQFSLRRRST